MIEGQNRLYQVFDQPHFRGFDRGVIDRLKRSFYDCLGVLNRFEDTAAFKASTRDLVEGLFPTAAPEMPRTSNCMPANLCDFTWRASTFWWIGWRRRSISIPALTDVDMLLASIDPKQWHPDARRDVLVNYLGFPFWDVLTFPVMTWREVGEFNKILIDRISPQDADTLEEFGGSGCLKGVGFAHFAAFFSRAYRENDYLLGRIHALDRLIDIVCNSAQLDMNGERNAILALKKRGFMQILDAEEKHLPNSAALITALRRSIAGLGASASEERMNRRGGST